ncbi:MAG: LOG family protein, partial [Pseudonocardiales bacterium]
MGTRLAAAGHSLVSGGGRVSMMGAVAVAARAGGAQTVGVIPAHLMPYEVADTDADDLVIVDTMRERKRVMDERCDVV